MSTELTVGATLTSRARTITEADLVSFAALTGDWHPQHSDAEWAASSRFGERIAHGMLVLSYSIGLIAFDPERVVALRGLDSVTFKRPVAIGETIRVEAEVDEATPLDDGHELVSLTGGCSAPEDRLAVRATVRVVHRTADAARANGVAEEALSRTVSCCDAARRQADPRHRSGQPTLDRLRDRRARPAGGRRGAADQLRPRPADDRARREGPPEPPDVLELDVDSEADLAALTGELSGRWGGVDGVVHAIAFAPGDALGGNFLATPRESRCGHSRPAPSR